MVGGIEQDGRYDSNGSHPPGMEFLFCQDIFDVVLRTMIRGVERDGKSYFDGYYALVRSFFSVRTSEVGYCGRWYDA